VCLGLCIVADCCFPAGNGECRLFEYSCGLPSDLEQYIDRMEVPSSSGWSHFSCSGTSPLFIMCLQSCLAVRCSVCEWFAW